jgi:hypothetical protein
VNGEGVAEAGREVEWVCGEVVYAVVAEEIISAFVGL